MISTNLVFYILSFISIWVGAGFIVSATSKFSKKLKLSPFAFSFVILGILTSIPEFSVGLQAVSRNDAPIFIGNLLGGVIVLFLGVIPLLAIFGNGILIKKELDSKTLIATLAVIITPAALILDRKITNIEGIFMIGIYILLLFIVEGKKGIFDRKNTKILRLSAYSFKDILKILLGIVIVFASSSVIVNKTLFFAETFHISEFYISLIFVSLGTNLPELSVAVRSILTGKKDIAMGDYLGSAAANTLLFGFFTLIHPSEVLTESRFLITFIFIALGLVLFYLFSNSKNMLSRKEGMILLLLYIAFICFELL